MSKTIEIAKELKGELDKLPLFQEYKRVKSLVESNEEIQELKVRISKAKASGEDKLHKELLNRYNNYPLIVNLQELEKEAVDYLSQIAKIVNKK